MPDANTLTNFRILDGTSILLADGQEGYDGWEQVAVVGDYEGHWQGKFQITEAMLHQMADFGNSKKIKTAFDYGHELVYNSAAPAAGWVMPGDFKVEGKGKDAALFVKPAFTKKARDMIESGELLYKSPTIVFNTVDRETGKTGGSSLHSIALTNTPFLHELPEVRLNAIMGALTADQHEPSKDAGKEIQMKSITTMLGLTDGTAEEHIANAIKVLQDRADDFEGRYNALTAGLDGDPVAALAELQAKAATADAHAVALKAFEAEKASREASELSAKVDGAMKALQDNGQLGGVDSPEFKTWRAFAETDFARFSELSAALPKKTPVGDDEKKPKEKAANVALSDEQREINAKFGISDEVFLKHNTADQA